MSNSNIEGYPLAVDPDPELPIDGDREAQIIQAGLIRRVQFSKAIEELMPPSDPADIATDSF